MLLCSKMGCFSSFYAFDNATVYAFNNGVRWVRALKWLFLQCFGGGEPGTSYSRGCAKYRAWSWGTMPKMRLFKAHFCSLHMACASGLDRVWNRFLFCNVQKCPELQGKCFFYIVGVKFATWRSKSGFRKKAKIYFWCRTHHHFCVFWCRALFWQKTVFPKSAKFRWNHWKRSAKLARPQNTILAPEGPKWAILVRVTKRSRHICRCIRGACRYIFKKTRTIVWYFLLFPFLTTSHFLSF